MALTIRKPAAAALAAAAFSMLATPAAALERPHTGAVQVHDADAINAERNRRWRDRDRIDTGDVLAGILIIGGIAAIASAASKPREPEVRYPPPPPRGASGNRFESRGIERAVDICVSEVEGQGDRVASVESAARTGEGWHVAGEIEGGEPYSCWIGNDGLVSDIDIGRY